MEAIAIIKDWAATHWVLWPSLVVVLFAYGMVLWWWSVRKDRVSGLQFLFTTLSVLLGLAVVFIALVDDLPAWFRRASVLSALGVLLCIFSLLSFVVSHIGLERETKKLEEKHKKTVLKEKEKLATQLGLIETVESAARKPVAKP